MVSMDKALRTAEILQQRGIPISRQHAYSLLRDFTKSQDLEHCRRLQFLLVQSGLNSISVMGNHLIRLFGACGCLIETNQAFNGIVKPCEHTWVGIIAAYAKLGQGNKAISLYSRMLELGLSSNTYIYVVTLQACTARENFITGRYVHGHIINSGMQSDIIVGNTLIDMYAKCGSLSEACGVFDTLHNRDVVSCAVMMAGYVHHGKHDLALEAFCHMQNQGIKPNSSAFSSALKACGSIGGLEQVRCIHEQIIGSGLQLDVVVGSTLIDMYSKCGSLDDADDVFNTLSVRNVVAWGAIIAGYVQHGEGIVATHLFDSMKQEGVQPNEVTLSSTLRGCGIIGVLEQGRLVHEEIIESGFQSDIVLGNTLIDMYAKCGTMEEAQKVFYQLPNWDVASWNAMISGYAQLGNARFAVQYFDLMQYCDFKPDQMTFTALLSACSCAGLTNEGLGYFKLMHEYHGITRNVFHYNCMVDLLGRAGYFKEAEDVLQGQPTVCGWTSLLNSCRMHANKDFGKLCFTEIIHLDSDCVAGYMLISDIYRIGAKESTSVHLKDDIMLI